MYVKKRNNRVNLSRAMYVPEGETGQGLGRVVVNSVGSLSTDSQTISPLLAKKLTAAEFEYVRRRIGNQTSKESEREEAPASMVTRTEVPNA